MGSVYAVIKRYEQDGQEYKEWVTKPYKHDWIYEQMMIITGNDHEISSDAASWCELATVGEIYEFREGEIEIMDID